LTPLAAAETELCGPIRIAGQVDSSLTGAMVEERQTGLDYAHGARMHYLGLLASLQAVIYDGMMPGMPKADDAHQAATYRYSEAHIRLNESGRWLEVVWNAVNAASEARRQDHTARGLHWLGRAAMGVLQATVHNQHRRAAWQTFIHGIRPAVSYQAARETLIPSGKQNS
jgi:hypothetical protein